MAIVLVRGGQNTGTQRGKTMGRHGEKTAIYKPMGRASEETNPASILISEASPPEW